MMLVSYIIITCCFQTRVHVDVNIMCCSKVMVPVTFIHVITSWNIEYNALLLFKECCQMKQRDTCRYPCLLVPWMWTIRSGENTERQNFPIQFYLSNLKSRLSWLNGRLLFCVRLHRECHNLFCSWMCPKLSIYYIVLISLCLFYKEYFAFTRNILRFNYTLKIKN